MCKLTVNSSCRWSHDDDRKERLIGARMQECWGHVGRKRKANVVSIWPDCFINDRRHGGRWVCRIKKLHDGSACACKEVEVNGDTWVLHMSWRLCACVHRCIHWRIISVPASLTSWRRPLCGKEESRINRACGLVVPWTWRRKLN